MRTVTTLATFVIVLSLIYALNGAYIIIDSIQSRDLLAYYGVKENLEIGAFTLGTYFRISVIVGSFFMACGMTALISAIGLLKAKEWARKIWLAIALLLLVINIPWTACYYSGLYNRIILMTQVVLTVVTYALTVASWILLTQGPIKSIFQPSAMKTD